MRHCRRSTSHFGYDRSGEGWVFERKKKRDRERSREGREEIRVETRGAEKRNRNPSYLSGYVFPPSVLARFHPSLRQAFVEIKLPLLSLYLSPFLPPSSLLWILSFSVSCQFLLFSPFVFILFLPSFSPRETRSPLSRLTRVFFAFHPLVYTLEFYPAFVVEPGRNSFSKGFQFEGMEGRRMSNDLIAGFPCQTIINLLRCKYCCFNLSVRRLKKKEKRREKKKTFCPFN